MNRHVTINLGDMTVSIRRGEFNYHPLKPGRTYHPSIRRLFWFINRYCSKSKGRIAWLTVVPNA